MRIMATEMQREVKFSKGCFSQPWIHLFPCWWLPNLYLSSHPIAQGPRPYLHSLLFIFTWLFYYQLTLNICKATYIFSEWVPSWNQILKPPPSPFYSSVFVFRHVTMWLGIKRQMVYKILSHMWPHGSSSHQLWKVNSSSCCIHFTNEEKKSIEGFRWAVGHTKSETWIAPQQSSP